MTEHDIYELDFQDVYEITFDDVAPQPDSTDVINEPLSQSTTLAQPATSVPYPRTNNDNPERKKWQTIELKSSRDYVLETILAHGTGDLHVSRLIQNHFGARHIEDEQYRQLLNDLDELAQEGYISRMADSAFIWCEPQLDERPVSAPEILSITERQRKAAEFVRDLMFHTKQVEADGMVKSTVIARDYRRGLRIGEPDAKQLVQTLVDERLLFYAGDYKGTRQLTSNPDLAVDESSRQRQKKATKERLKLELLPEDQEIISAILDTLDGVKHVEQSIPIKKIWSDGYLGNLVDEKDFRRVIRVLAAKGIISTDKQQGQFRTSFATQAIHRQWKDDKGTLMEALYESPVMPESFEQNLSYISQG